MGHTEWTKHGLLANRQGSCSKEVQHKHENRAGLFMLCDYDPCTAFPLLMVHMSNHCLILLHISRLGRLGFDFRELGASRDF